MLNRSDFLKLITTGALGTLVSSEKFYAILNQEVFRKDVFGSGFRWGVTTSAFQTEGAWNEDGKGLSIWDVFTQIKGKIKDHSDAKVTCDFYHNYKADISLLRNLNFDSFRFSLSWSRILPEGKGDLNQKGIDFYNRVIDSCLELGIEPWLTLYHWDLPQKLENEGGWTNRDIIGWFSDYTALCAKMFGDRIKSWVVLNEPTAFTTFGYLTGLHAPGRRGLNGYLSAVHHATLCQAEGGRILKEILPNAKVGSAFSCSYVDAKKTKPRFQRAAKRLDVVLNRLFIEPSLGMGYPWNDVTFFRKIEKFMKQGDEEKMKFNFDFIGLQNYFRVIGKPGLIPFIWANQDKPDENTSMFTEMGWEVYPEGIYKIIKRFAAYPVKEFIITENGAAFHDVVENGKVNDANRIHFFKTYLQNILRAKNEGVNITGYFVWTFIDNFEWSEGYLPRFGIVYNDFRNQQRIIKDSGYWFKEFLK
jgi:beta-glucosidase